MSKTFPENTQLRATIPEASQIMLIGDLPAQVAANLKYAFNQYASFSFSPLKGFLYQMPPSDLAIFLRLNTIHTTHFKGEGESLRLAFFSVKPGTAMLDIDQEITEKTFNDRQTAQNRVPLLFTEALFFDYLKRIYYKIATDAPFSFIKGKKHNPHALFVLENYQALKEISQIHSGELALTKIQKRIDYLESILWDPDLFKSSTFIDRTVRDAIRTTLKSLYTLFKNIENQIKNKTPEALQIRTRENIKAIVKALTIAYVYILGSSDLARTRLGNFIDHQSLPQSEHSTIVTEFLDSELGNHLSQPFSFIRKKSWEDFNLGEKDCNPREKAFKELSNLLASNFIKQINHYTGMHAIFEIKNAITICSDILLEAKQLLTYTLLFNLYYILTENLNFFLEHHNTIEMLVEKLLATIENIENADKSIAMMLKDNSQKDYHNWNTHNVPAFKAQFKAIENELALLPKSVTPSHSKIQFCLPESTSTLSSNSTASHPEKNVIFQVIGWLLKIPSRLFSMLKAVFVAQPPEAPQAASSPITDNVNSALLFQPTTTPLTQQYAPSENVLDLIERWFTIDPTPKPTNKHNTLEEAAHTTANSNIAIQELSSITNKLSTSSSTALSASAASAGMHANPSFPQKETTPSQQKPKKSTGTNPSTAITVTLFNVTDTFFPAHLPVCNQHKHPSCHICTPGTAFSSVF